MKRYTDEEIERAAERFSELADRLDPSTTPAERPGGRQPIVDAIDGVRRDGERHGPEAQGDP